MKVFLDAHILFSASDRLHFGHLDDQDVYGVKVASSIRLAEMLSPTPDTRHG